ncbi:MAG: ABC transporter permease subunit [Dehalococcoidia bacterium]
MLRALSPAGWVALGAFVLLALLPVLLLGAMWLIPALARDPQMLTWAVPSLRTLQLLGKSFLLATTVAFMATVLGTLLALWLCGDGRWQRFVRSVYLVPLLIPPYVHALTWMSIAGQRQFLDQALGWILGPERFVLSTYGFWPTAVVLTLATFPIVTLLVRSGLQAIEPEILEAASLVEPPWRVARRLLPRLVLPSILAGAGLVFVLALVEYGVPSMFEYNVYVTEVYASFSQDFDAVKAFAISLPLVVLAAVLLALSQSHLRNSPLRGRPGSHVALPTSQWPWPVRALLLLGVGVWAIASAVPIVVLLARGAMPSTMAAAVSPAWGEIALTVIVAIGCGVIAVAVALPLAAFLTRPTGIWKLGWLVCALPLAVPAPVMGIALIYLWNHPLLGWGYGTPLMLVVAHVARFLPFGVYAAASRVHHIDPLLAEAASLPAVGWWRRFLWVRLPMIAPAIAITLLVVFVLSLGELGASLLIAPPGEATLPMRIYNLLHYGATDLVSALSLTILLVSGVACAALLVVRHWLWKRAS